MRLKDELPELLDDLAPSASLTQLGAAVLPPISRAVHADRSALIVEGKVVAALGVPPRSVHGSRQAFPTRFELRLPDGTTGEILLGPRPDGTPQAGDELDSLAAIAPALARGIARTACREREERRRRAAEHSLAQQIAALSQRVRRIETVANPASGATRTQRES